MKQELFALIDHLKTRLNERVYDQPTAVLSVTEGLMMDRLQSSRELPNHIFTFFGPASCGKTLLAQTLAETLEIPFSRFELSSLLPAPADAPSPSEAEAEATPPEEIIDEESSGGVLLIDAIEKAPPRAQNALLEFLEEGVEGLIVIFTTTMESFWGQKQFAQQFESHPLKTQAAIAQMFAEQTVMDDDGPRPALTPELAGFLAKHHLVPFFPLSLDALVHEGLLH